jgi:hypothetical protein
MMRISRCRCARQVAVCIAIIGLGLLRSASAQVDLYVGTHNFGEPVFHFDGSTGAFINSFGSFPGERGEGIAADNSGDVWASYFDSGLIRRFDGHSGALLDTYSPGIVEPDGNRSLRALRLGSDGMLYGLEANHLFRYNPLTDTGQFLFADNGRQDNYQRLAFGPDGLVYVSAITGDSLASGIQRFDPSTGAYLGRFITEPANGMAFGADGLLYLADSMSQISRYDIATGSLVDVFVPAGSGGMGIPLDITFGPDGNLYVNNPVAHDVLRFNGTTGAFMDTFVSPGSGGLVRPESLVFAVQGNAVPEPGSLATLAGFAVPLWLGLRRRCRH